MATLYELLAFGLFAAITAGSSVGVVLVRDVWHAALLLGVALLSVAVHYVMLRAEFLAAMQVLVYVGGVLILITFAVMLVRRPPGADETAGAGWPRLRLGSHLSRGIGAVALLAVLALVTVRTPFGPVAGFPVDASITASIGRAMFDLEGAAVPSENFLVAFEIIDIVLVAALVGAVMLARREVGGRLRAALRPDGGDEE